MSKLANAPLVEVIFELRWTVKDQTELNQHQYLHGDLYNSIKDKYPLRENILPVGVPIEIDGLAIHRFRPQTQQYPLIQVGLGVLTVNTTDEAYDWEDYKDRCVEAVDKLFSVFELVKGKEYVTLSLQYQDFIAYPSKNINLYQFLNENLHINLSQAFYTNSDNPRALALSFHYDTPCGILEVTIHQAKKQDSDETGLLISFKVSNPQSKPNFEMVNQWLEDAHKITDKTFKQMMMGNLMTSFQKP